MAASLSGEFNFQSFTDGGLPAAGYRVYTYAAGTTTQKTAYTDAAAAVPHTYTSDGGGGQYIATNSRGELPAPLFLTSGGYDVALKTSSGVTVWTRRAYGQNDSDATLAADMASTADAAKGAGQIGFNPALSYATDTIGAAAKRIGSVSQFAGADPTGSVDSLAAVNSAAGVASATASMPMIDGVYKISAQWLLPRYITAFGAGKTSDASSSKRSPSTVLKDFNGTGVLLGYDDSALENVQIDNVTGKTGDNIQLSGSRTSLRWVTSTNSGGVGVRVGTSSATATDGTTPNTNIWSLVGVQVISSASHGIEFNDPTAGVDANGGLMLGGDIRNNGGDGVKIDNAHYNTIVGPTIQSNTGVTARLTSNSRGTTWVGGDLEPGAGGIGVIESGTFGNYIAGAFYGGAPAMWSNLARGSLKGRNWLVQHNANLAKMALHDELNIYDPDAGGTPSVNGWAEPDGSEINVWRIEGSKSGASGGKWKVQTKKVGGSLTDAIIVDDSQNIATGGLMAGTQTVPTIASAGTIAPTAPVSRVSGSTTISTITVPAFIAAQGFGSVTLISIGAGGVTTNTAGNIARTIVAPAGMAIEFVWVSATSLWYPKA